jgi:malate/lactate dehydrogenase
MKDIYMGVPVILGKEGAEKIVEVKLTKEERLQFRKSCASVRKLIKKLSI